MILAEESLRFLKNPQVILAFGYQLLCSTMPAPPTRRHQVLSPSGSCPALSRIRFSSSGSALRHLDLSCSKRYKILRIRIRPCSNQNQILLILICPATSEIILLQAVSESRHPDSAQIQAESDFRHQDLPCSKQNRVLCHLDLFCFKNNQILVISICSAQSRIRF
jgi:hypothetical protein